MDKTSTPFSQTLGLFSTFVIGLSSAALIEMGVMADPSTGETRKNREAARQHIEILVMLQQKTRGNLDENERTLLDQALTDLKLQFAKNG